MTSESDFQAALDADPTDRHTRLVFADWLQDRGDPRADGYRALGLLRLRPHAIGNRNWWTAQGDGHPYYNHLPPDWFKKVAGYRHTSITWRWPMTWDESRDNRAEIENAAALAFAHLSAKRRAKLLAQTGRDARPQQAPAPARRARKKP